MTIFQCRSLPSKRSGMALFAIFGTSFTGMVRYIFGQWIPSFEQLIYSKVALSCHNKRLLKAIGLNVELVSD